MKNSLLLFCYLLCSVACSQEERGDSNSLVKLIIEKNKDGSPAKVGYTINRKRTGEWKSFIRNRLVCAINYKDNLQHGKETWYNRCSGRIIEEGYNNNGKPVGLWYKYIEGELLVIVEHKGDSSIYVYHNPKFRDATDLPPPTKLKSTEQCEFEH